MWNDDCSDDEFSGFSCEFKYKKRQQMTLSKINNDDDGSEKDNDYDPIENHSEYNDSEKVCGNTESTHGDDSIPLSSSVDNNREGNSEYETPLRAGGGRVRYKIKWKKMLLKRIFFVVFS